MPPRARPPRRTPRAIVYRRRLVALGVLVAGFAIAWFAVASIGGGKTKAPTTALLPPRPFKVVFPEGFTRAQMAHRVSAVARIAEHERGRAPALNGRPYLANTRLPRREPGFGSTRLPLEGFLFPATYDFTIHTTAAQLVAQQLDAFRRNWAKVDLGCARARPARSVLRQLEAARPRVRALQASDPVRRLDHRLHGREGDALSR